MRDHERGAIAHGRLQRRLNHAFAFSVERTRGLIEQQQRRIFQHGAGNRNALALPPAQAHAALAQERAITFRQGADEFIGERRFGSGPDFVLAGLGLAVANVFECAAGEDHRVLRHQADALAQIMQSHVARGHAVQHDLSRSRIVKAQQQLKHGAFARAAGPHDGDCLARRHAQGELMQGGLGGSRRIVEVDAIELDRTAGPRCGHGQRLRG